MEGGDRWHNTTLRDYLRILGRRKWILFLTVILVTTLAVFLSARQQRQYEASAKVLISRQSAASQVTGNQDPTQYTSPERILGTQADLARVRVVAKRTLKAAGLTDRSADAFLGQSSVSAKSNADLLVFTVRDPIPARAVRLANVYAAQYTQYRHELDTAALKQARAEVEQRLAKLEAGGDTAAALYTSLTEKDQQLRTLEALQTSNAHLVETADSAPQVAPRPTRSGVLGFLLGLILGIGLVFLFDALDTRVRSADEISARLRLPLLGRLPEPTRTLRAEGKLVMVEKPRSAEAEAFRVLRTNIDFVNFERGARTIMVTSAVQGEGKSTTAANLAIALARGGKHVVLVDLDLRRSYLDKFFALDGSPGVTDVTLAHGDPREAATIIALMDATNGTADANENGRGRIAEGTLAVLGSGPLPPDPGEFIETHGLGETLDSLASHADVVLVDAPPLLGLGDAIALSGKVDAMLIVTRLNVMRRPMLNELHRILETCPAAKLGFVLTGAESEEGYADAYRYGYHYYGQREKEKEKEKEKEVLT